MHLEQGGGSRSLHPEYLDGESVCKSANRASSQILMDITSVNVYLMLVGILQGSLYMTERLEEVDLRDRS